MKYITATILMMFMLWVFVPHYTSPNYDLLCIDGDTFALIKDKTPTYYRLSYIDTPEKNQIGYHTASDYTCKQLSKANFRIVEHGKDVYGRTLAEVYLQNGQTLNEILIIKGYAIPYFDNTTDKIMNLYATIAP